MTFTEFEGEKKRYRNNWGEAATLLGPLIIIIIIIMTVITMIMLKIKKGYTESTAIE